MIIATKHDLETYLADPTTHDAALAHLQCLMDERFNYDAAGGLGIVEPNGLTRLGVTAAEAVAMGAADRVVDVPAGPTLAEVQAQACARLNAKRDAVKFGVFTDSHGIRYDVHKDGRDNFTGLEAKIANGLVLPDGFAWTDADNQQRQHTNATILALTTEILFWSSMVHDACVAAKTAIRDPAVTAAAQVAAIESGVVWP